VESIRFDIAFASPPEPTSGITAIDYFSALDDTSAYHLELNESSGDHSPFIHSYPPGDASSNGFDFLIPKSIISENSRKILVYRLAARTDFGDADDNAFSWGTISPTC